MPLRQILLLVLLLGSLPVCFVRPFYGILVWDVLAFLNPQSFTWAAVDAFPWALAVAIPTIAGYFFFEKTTGASRTRECYLILALWLWFTITTGLSINDPTFMHHAAETVVQWKFVSKVLVMTVLSLCIVNSFERLRILIMVMSGCFGLYVLKDLPFIIRTHGAFRLYGPDHSMIADNNDFGLALNMTLPIFFFLGQTETKRWVRCGYFFLGVITIPAIFFTYSRGALVGLILVMTLMLLRSKQRFILAPVIVLAVVVALVFAPQAWKERMDPTRPDAVDLSAQERLNSWAFSRALAADYPIAGGGFETFTPELFIRYAPHGYDIHGPHSVYFQLLAEHGFVGLGLYLTLVLSCFITVFQLLRGARRNRDPLIANYAHLLRYSLLGFLSSGLFLGRAYFDYFFAIAACIAVLKTVAYQKWSTQAAYAEEDDDERAGLAGMEPTEVIS